MSALLFGRRREEGEILKAERMLVRIERIDNAGENIPQDYTEKSTVHTRLKRAWREYYVVARASSSKSKHVILHIYNNRVFLSVSRINSSEFQ
jgi:hypothetical protein